MRRLTIALTVFATASLAFAPAPDTTPSGELGQLVRHDLAAPDGAAVTSDNVVYLGTLPTESPGVGGDVVQVGDQTRFYVTGAKGASVYDVTDPTLPVLLGHLPLPHFQNEDVDVAKDGSRMIVSADTASASPTGASALGIHVIDVTDGPAGTLTLTEAAFVSPGSHTATCADDACEWIYGSNTRIYHAPIGGEAVDTGKRWKQEGGSHALFRDATGLMISDSNPRLVLDPRETPDAPVVLAQGTASHDDGFLQHNSDRPHAQDWAPRDPEDPADAYEELPPQSPIQPLAGALPEGSLRAGELLIGGGESNLNPTCADAGGLTTWDMRDFDKGRQMRPLEFFNPTNGTYADGDPTVNGLGCSSHWFTVKGNQVTASWYEHGVRFFEVGLDTGAIEQTGFFQPVATEAGAAHWVKETEHPVLGTVEIVYSVDYARGIDILAFLPDAETPSDEEFLASWMANAARAGTGVFANAERYLCRLGATGSAPITDPAAAAAVEVLTSRR